MGPFQNLLNVNSHLSVSKNSLRIACNKFVSQSMIMCLPFLIRVIVAFEMLSCVSELSFNFMYFSISVSYQMIENGRNTKISSMGGKSKFQLSIELVDSLSNTILGMYLPVHSMCNQYSRTPARLSY